MGPLILVGPLLMAIVFLALTALTILIQFQRQYSSVWKKKSIEEPEAVEWKQLLFQLQKLKITKKN